MGLHIIPFMLLLPAQNLIINKKQLAGPLQTGLCKGKI